MSHDDAWWQADEGDPAGAAWEAYDALNHLRHIDLRRITDPRLRALVREARGAAAVAYHALWSDPALARARQDDYDMRRDRWLDQRAQAQAG